MLRLGIRCWRIWIEERGSLDRGNSRSACIGNGVCVFEDVASISRKDLGFGIDRDGLLERLHLQLIDTCDTP
jgi:hypothetical protein